MSEEKILTEEEKPIKEAAWTSEMFRDMISHWKANESAIDVPAYNRKGEEYFPMLKDLFISTFPGWDWKMLYSRWRIAALNMGKNPKGEPKDRVLSFGELAQAIRTVKTEQKALPEPTETPEQRQHREKMERMTHDEKMAYYIGRIENTTPQLLPMYLITTPAEIFGGMKTELTADENERFENKAWGDLCDKVMHKYKVPISDFNHENDRYDLARKKIEEKLRQRGQFTDIDGIDGFIRRNNREVMWEIYSSAERKYFQPNIEPHE